MRIARSSRNLRISSSFAAASAIQRSRSLRELERWDVLVSILFVNLERNRPVPFLPSHREKLFWCERIERHLPEEEEVGFAAQRGIVRQGRRELLKMRPEFLERIRRALHGIVQFLLPQGGGRRERPRHSLQASADALQGLNRDTRKWRGRFFQILGRLLQDRGDVLDSDENFPAVRIVVGRRHGEGFRECGQSLIEIKIRVAFPARIDLQFPMHPSERGTDQSIINLLRDRPLAGVDLCPTRLEFLEIGAAFFDGRA